MQCKCVSINIVTLLLAWRDCQNGTLDSINSVHPPHTLRDTHTHTNTCAQNKHTVSHHSMFIPMLTQCNHGDQRYTPNANVHVHV